MPIVSRVFGGSTEMGGYKKASRVATIYVRVCVLSSFWFRVFRINPKNISVNSSSKRTVNAVRRGEILQRQWMVVVSVVAMRWLL